MNIALIAHDAKKDEMVALVKVYKNTLTKHTLLATGTTGGRVADETGLNIHRVKSGPLGGDQEIGAKVSNGEIDMILFLRDPLTAHPHEPDVSALLRLSDIYQVALATNRRTAALLLESL
jgi:methylglyoxal synthase